ncbi:MAG: hypothetical protein LBG46_02820 [Elusimicrobiota bacterium]|jgi:hypothetical protein|nr:hypothetical protein [Elusimicrobiota bacterium]
MKIKIELQKVFDKGIAYRVLEQDDSLRYDSVRLSFNASNGITIVSNMCPQISYPNIYIRGSNRLADKEEASYWTGSREKRDVLFDRILDAFKEFAEKGYFGRPEKEETETVNEDNVHEF